MLDRIIIGIFDGIVLLAIILVIFAILGWINVP